MTKEDPSCQNFTQAPIFRIYPTTLNRENQPAPRLPSTFKSPIEDVIPQFLTGSLLIGLILPNFAILLQETLPQTQYGLPAPGNFHALETVFSACY